MGCHGGSAETGCFTPTGLLPDREISVGGVIDSERWSAAEERVAELVALIQPNEGSWKRRQDVADYIQSLIGKCFSCQVFIFGSVPLMTYLTDGDIDLTIFSDDENLKNTWAGKVHQVMKEDQKNENAKLYVKEVQLIEAEVKVIKCLVDGIVVDISFCQTGGLRALCLLEEMDRLISKDHLFKRSIILIKAWCYYESRLLGAQHGLISTFALETMILYIFHLFDNSFSGPLEVLYRFLEIFSSFDWKNCCVSIWGPVSRHLLPEITTAMPPRKKNGEFDHKKLFLQHRSKFIDSLACGQHCHRQPFTTKCLNIVDPLCIHNNLGRSVYEANFYRICSAFAFGVKKLSRLLDFPKEEMISELNHFFVNTWERHRADPHNSSATSAAHSEPSKNISFNEHINNISEDPGDDHRADLKLSFYGATSQILRVINQNSEDISRHNGIKSNKDYSNDNTIKNLDYVEKTSANPVRTNKNDENLSYNNSNGIEEGDSRLQGQLGMVRSEKIHFRSHPTNLGEVSNGESHDTIQKSHIHEAENYRAPLIAVNTEVTKNQTAQISDYGAISNSGVVSSIQCPTGPPVPFLAMLQIYNFPSHRRYYDGLYGLSDDEILNFDRNVDSGGTFDWPDIHVAAHVKPVLSNGISSTNISLFGPTPRPCPTIAPNVYFRRIFPPIQPVGSIPSPGVQVVPAACALPEPQIAYNALSFGDGAATHYGGIVSHQPCPRVVLGDLSQTAKQSWNCSPYGTNLDKGEQNYINRSPQMFWLTNEPSYSEKPNTLAGCLNPDYSQISGSSDYCRSSYLAESSSIGSSSFSRVSTYVTQGMDYPQFLTVQSSSSLQRQRFMVQKNHQLKEEGFPR
ncbi:uncharacterized protein LOC110029263 isoform X2 [Phalaenopsis equestris]|uniref:uncharacterized protein LOC110029263 isoform X2 n=1 Tax=Phalaenopsis equestris TaxID=78828 RepID=UPI0009E20E64|nr:uncharacterized protein LOC110029263 isoform X2 [Phalaenopsis equestris]